MHLLSSTTAALLCLTLTVAAQEWESTVSPYAPGEFPTPRPLRAQYGFGWNGIVAATADLRLTKSNDQLQLDGTGGTIGVARSLWRFDAKHSSTTDSRTLRPLRVHEVQTERAETSETELTFTPEGVTSREQQRKNGNTKDKTRQFEFPNVMSLSSSFLYLRSQPLTPGAVYRTVVYPATSAYLSTITVHGTERITVPAGTYDAIKLHLQLSKITKERELKRYKKFKEATIWISNDPDRLVLRIEARVFIGAVFAELQSVEFQNGPTPAPAAIR